MAELLNQGGSHDSEAAEDGTFGLSVVRRALNGTCPYLPARAAQCIQFPELRMQEPAVELEVWCAVCGVWQSRGAARRMWGNKFLNGEPLRCGQSAPSTTPPLFVSSIHDPMLQGDAAELVELFPQVCPQCSKNADTAGSAAPNQPSKSSRRRTAPPARCPACCWLNPAVANRIRAGCRHDGIHSSFLAPTTS